MSDPYAMAAAAKAQIAADSARDKLRELEASQTKAGDLDKRLTRLEVKLDAIGLLIAGSTYAQVWDDADFHQSKGMK